MIISTKFKTLLIVVLLSSAAAAGADDGKNHAPEATAVEAELSFRDIPYLDAAFIDATPADREDGLVVGELGVDGGNKDMIVKLAQEIADNRHGSFDSLLIAHKNKLIFESYYLRGRINLPHPQASVTKVYTSLAIGRAIQLGYLTMADLDKPLIGFLNDLDPEKFVDGVEKITLHQAMTMSSGLRINEDKLRELRGNPGPLVKETAGPLQGQGQVQAFFEHSAPITAESQSFYYQFTDPDLVMQVIDAVVPGTAEDFIKIELLDKMGIASYGWWTDLSGLPRASGGSSMTSRNMLKWGTLAINNGRWNGEQLVPEAFIARATDRIVLHSDDENFLGGDNVFNTGYGYFWWQADLATGDKRYFSTAARGGGGQYIIAIEELDLIVVVTAHDRNNNTSSLMATRILPAFVQSDLEAPYLGQRPPGLTPEPFAPGIVTTKSWEYGGAFTPDMKEFYFTRTNDENDKREFVVFENKNGRWHETVIGPRIGQPFITPDGKTMHLGRRYKVRTDTGWSERENLGSPFDEISIMRLTASTKGTLVFDEFTRDGNGVLRHSQLVDGKHTAPKPLGKAINTGKWNAHPFIAPDESYILWDSKREGGYGDSDIYLSFRQQDGSWGKAINLGDKINTDAWEAAASVTPDGKYLFFNRNIGSDKYENVDIFWVDAQVIEDLRPKNENGTSTASPYFGQKPPGLTPEVFAPGVVSINGRHEGVVSFSPNLDEVYFNADNSDQQTSIYFSRLQGDNWTLVKKADFGQGGTDEEIHPSVSPDGKKIYFTAISSDLSYNKIWYVNRSNNGWSSARILESPANDDQVFYPNQSRDGELYYFNISKFQTYRASGDTNGFSKTEPVDIEFGVHAFIAPSQDYLVLNARHKEDENRNDNEIYVSFKQENGIWTKPINLGEQVNSQGDDRAPTISPDGKYLFFGRDEEVGAREANIYWVSTEVIENLRPAP